MFYFEKSLFVDPQNFIAFLDNCVYPNSIFDFIIVSFDDTIVLFKTNVFCDSQILYIWDNENKMLIELRYCVTKYNTYPYSFDSSPILKDYAEFWMGFSIFIVANFYVLVLGLFCMGVIGI